MNAHTCPVVFAGDFPFFLKANFILVIPLVKVFSKLLYFFSPSKSYLPYEIFELSFQTFNSLFPAFLCITFDFLKSFIKFAN